MTERPEKRYIAGAVCPVCGVVDKIYVFEREDGMTRCCNRCGFEETMPHGPDNEWQPVRIGKKHE